MLSLLKELCHFYGPSGREQKVIEFIRDQIKHQVDSIKIDAMGSLIALKRGESSQKRLMFVAHADEIGLAVTFVDNHGFLYFSMVGGVNPKNKLGGARVRFENGIRGVIQQKEVMKGKTPEVYDLYIDIGTKSQQETLSQVAVGDFAVFESESFVQGDYFISKAIDDRVGCLVLMEVLSRLKKPVYDTYFVFSTQEEVGTRGAKTAAYEINADLGLAIDVTLCGDTPEEYPVNMGLGKGVAIKSRDRNIIVPQSIIDWLQELAIKNKIDWHMEVLPFGGTDAGAIQLAKGGSAAGTLSIPCRYVHSPSEMVDLNDVKHTIELVEAIIKDDLSFLQ